MGDYDELTPLEKEVLGDTVYALSWKPREIIGLGYRSDIGACRPIYRKTREEPVLMPERYRKKPVIIQATQLPKEASIEDIEELETVARHYGLEVAWNQEAVPGIIIRTLEGVMRAEPGDWIISGVMGELYPCKPDIFEATYEGPICENCNTVEEPGLPHFMETLGHCNIHPIDKAGR